MLKMIHCRMLFCVLFCVMCLPTAAISKNRTLIFKNNTGRNIQFAIAYQTQDGTWRKAGWFFIKPHSSTSLDRYCVNNKMFVYAKDSKADWHWPSQSKKQGVTYTVSKKAFNVDAQIRLETLKYFNKMDIGNFSKYIWTFR